jgi:hypothetical protein
MIYSANTQNVGQIFNTFFHLTRELGSPESLVISDVYHQSKINIPGILF